MRNFASHVLFSGVFLLSSQTVTLSQTAPQRPNLATGGDRQAMSDGPAIGIDWAKLPSQPQPQNSSANFQWDTLKSAGSEFGGSPDLDLGASKQPQARFVPHSIPAASSTVSENLVPYLDVNSSRRSANVVQASGNSWNGGRPSAGVAEATSSVVPALINTPPQTPYPLSASTTLSFTDADGTGPGLITSHLQSSSPIALPISKPLHVEGKSLMVGMIDLPSEQPSGSAISQVGLQLETLIPKDVPANDETVSTPDLGPLELLSLIQRDGRVNEQGDLEVGSMIAPLENASDLVRRSDIENSLLEAPVLFGTDVRGYIGAVDDSTPWPAEIKTWVTPTFEHNPLYFEQVNLERYGYGPRSIFQPLASSAHFYGSILILPYKLCSQHPCEDVYPLGHQRPGDRACYQLRSFLGESCPGDASTAE